MYELYEILRESQFPVKSTQISEALGIATPTVRELVNELRCEGYPICSCHKGYYIATSYDDLKRTIASMEHRVAAMNDAILGMKLALDELGG